MATIANAMLPRDTDETDTNARRAVRYSFYVTYAFLVTTGTITFIEALRTTVVEDRATLEGLVEREREREADLGGRWSRGGEPWVPSLPEHHHCCLGRRPRPAVLSRGANNQRLEPHAHARGQAHTSSALLNSLRMRVRW